MQHIQKSNRLNMEVKFHFMRLFLIVLFIFFAFCAQSYGQSEKNDINTFYPYKNEIGINFTNVLGNVLSLNPDNASSPYGLTYRRHMGNISFRSAVNINITNSSADDFSNGLFIRRTLNIVKSDFRVGLEKHLVLHKRVLFSYGIDILGAIGNEKSEIQDFNLGGNTFISDKKTFGAGVGPVLRLEYKISDRIFISSESSLYGFISQTKSSLTINGTKDDDTKSSDSSLILVLPQSLFFNISF